MTQSVSHVQTARASQYLQQLCKHFGHKVQVEFDSNNGSVTFPFGICSLQAKEDELILSVDGSNADKLEQVIGSHLERFAFRESLTVTWDRTGNRQNKNSTNDATPETRP